MNDDEFLDEMQKVDEQMMAQARKMFKPWFDIMEAPLEDADARSITWRQVPTEMPQLWHEMKVNFNAIHGNHVRLVRNNMKYMAVQLPEHEDTLLFTKKQIPECQKELLIAAHRHDASKRQQPEYIPYVWRYYRTTWLANGEQDTRVTDFMKDPSLGQAIQDAIVHHVEHNRHHCDWHLDPDDMTELDIIEMCCDWYAMSQEHGTSIDAWVESVIPRRYYFGKKKAVVFKVIDILKGQPHE